MPNITKRLVDALDFSPKDYVMWDDKLKGFGIKVTPKGKKVYLLKCRMKTGEQRKYTLGAHGAITCEQGRKLAQDHLYQISQGIDPNEAYSKPADTSLSSLCDRYFNDYALIHKKPSSVKNNRTYIERYIKPKIGSLMVSTITRADIIEFHKELKHSPIQANRVVKMLSKVFSLSEEWGLRPENTNPARNIRMYPEKKRERFLSLDEIQRLMSALDVCEADKTVSKHACAMFRLLLLTGARLREIMHARWEWVDMQRGTLSLPDSKTGAKVIYLSSHALDILRKLPKATNNPYIIIGRDEGKPLNSERKQWLRICARADLHNVRIHDLRHSFASLAVLAGVPLYHVGKALGHKQATTTERYAHLADDPVRAVAEMIGEAIK